MPTCPLTQMLMENGVQSLSIRGSGMSVTFGSNKVKKLSDGQFPVEVYRCMKMEDGTIKEELRRTVRLQHRLEIAAREAGRGWRHGAVEQWVEMRTPKTRLNKESTP